MGELREMGSVVVEDEITILLFGGPLPKGTREKEEREARLMCFQVSSMVVVGGVVCENGVLVMEEESSSILLPAPIPGPVVDDSIERDRDKVLRFGTVLQLLLMKYSSQVERVNNSHWSVIRDIL